ncbi:Cytochrome P450 6A1, partial [Trachymyrmex septentrionalis]
SHFIICFSESYLVPTGTLIHINIYGVHRDPNFWPNPETFDPDRFYLRLELRSIVKCVDARFKTIRIFIRIYLSGRLKKSAEPLLYPVDLDDKECIINEDVQCHEHYVQICILKKK